MSDEQDAEVVDSHDTVEESEPRPGLAFVDIQRYQCHWPLEGEGINMRCCGLRVSNHVCRDGNIGYYCDEHRLRAYQKEKPIGRRVPKAKLAEIALRWQ
jgi:hypothetical protein